MNKCMNIVEHRAKCIAYWIRHLRSDMVSLSTVGNIALLNEYIYVTLCHYKSLHTAWDVNSDCIMENDQNCTFNFNKHAWPSVNTCCRKVFKNHHKYAVWTAVSMTWSKFLLINFDSMRLIQTLFGRTFTYIPYQVLFCFKSHPEKADC